MNVLRIAGCEAELLDDDLNLFRRLRPVVCLCNTRWLGFEFLSLFIDSPGWLHPISIFFGITDEKVNTLKRVGIFAGPAEEDVPPQGVQVACSLDQAGGA